MEQNTSERINYFLLMQKAHLKDIAPLRKWDNLKLAFEKDEIWITGFDKKQIESIEVKTIPYKTVFWTKDGKIFLQNSLLPDRKEPLFLWTSIQRAIPLELSKVNRNYFQLEEKIEVQLQKSDLEREVSLMLTSKEKLKQYIETAPEFRLQNLQWTIVGEEGVLIFGKPILPIQGKVFWQSETSFIPVGYDFDLSIISTIINNKINPNKDHWIIWKEDTSYFKVEKNLLKPLSISSVRRSFE